MDLLEEKKLNEKVLSLVNKYINIYYGKYSILRRRVYTQDDVASDVLFYLYKRDKEGNIILYKKIDLIKSSTYYLDNLIKFSVQMSLRSISRGLSNKPELYTLDYELPSMDSKMVSIAESIEDPKVDIEKEIILKVSLNKLEYKEYENLYYYTAPGKKVLFNNRLLLELIVMGKTITSIRESMYREDGKQVRYNQVSPLVKEVKEEMRKILYSDLYKEE